MGVEVKTLRLWRRIQSVMAGDARSRSSSQPLGNVLHLIHLHAVLLSQSLGIMTYDELRSPESPLCKHDIAVYVSQVGKCRSCGTPVEKSIQAYLEKVCFLVLVEVTSVTARLAWSGAEASGTTATTGLQVRHLLKRLAHT